MATALAGKVAVNLNFTAAPQSMAYAVEKAGIRTILTSRRFLAKAEIEQTPGMVMLEDVLKQFTLAGETADARRRAGAAGVAPRPP